MAFGVENFEARLALGVYAEADTLTPLLVCQDNLRVFILVLDCDATVDDLRGRHQIEVGPG